MSCIAYVPNFYQMCLIRMGGIRAIYLALRADVVSVSDDGYTLLIDFNSITRIPCRGSFQTVEQVNETTGASYYLDTLEVTPNRASAESGLIGLAMLAAADPDDLVILVETWNDEMFCLGYGFNDKNMDLVAEYPVFQGGGQFVTGTEKTDANGPSFTFTSAHPLPATLAVIVDPGSVDNPSTD